MPSLEEGSDKSEVGQRLECSFTAWNIANPWLPAKDFVGKLREKGHRAAKGIGAGEYHACTNA
jgi:hypothetical protein